MFFLFGEEFGREYSLWDFIGSLLVLAGLYFMGKTQKNEDYVDFRKWVLWTSIAFAAGLLYCLILEWRVLLQNKDLPDSIFLPFRIELPKSDLFIAIMFLVAALSQIAVMPPLTSFSMNKPLACGLIGGLLYVISTFFLILGTEVAKTSSEKALIFPLNTVLLIFLCNSWGRLLYHEKINWKATFLCALGIIITAWHS